MVEDGNQHLLGDQSLPLHPAMNRLLDVFPAGKDDQGADAIARQFINAFHDTVDGGTDPFLRNLPQNGPEVFGLQHVTDFVPENNDDDQGGTGDDALDDPGGDDQPHAQGDALENPQQRNAGHDPHHFGSPKQHIQTKQDKTGQKYIQNVLPAD